MRSKPPSKDPSIRTPAVERFSAMTAPELIAYCEHILSGEMGPVVPFLPMIGGDHLAGAGVTARPVSALG